MTGESMVMRHGTPRATHQGEGEDMAHDQGPNALTSRRDVLRIAGVGAMAVGLGVRDAGSREASASSASAQSASGRARGTGPDTVGEFRTAQDFRLVHRFHKLEISETCLRRSIDL
jgi:hypothetical protein